MLIDLVNKVLIILYVFSCLSVLRHGYYFIQTLLTTTVENPKKYVLNKTALLFLGLSIAYILSAIFIGIKI
jgi:hypothetical protein